VSEVLKKYKSLIFLSGGIDSTAVCYKLLKENTNQRFLIYHCNFRDYQHRHDYEKLAVNKIIRYFKENNLNNFDYINSDFSYGNINAIVQDIELWGFFMGLILRGKSYDIENISICASKFDLQQGEEYEARSRRRYNVIKALLEYEPVYTFPIKDLTREDLIKLLPKNLLEMTWFCRRPNDGRPCGKCKTCVNTLPYLHPLK
jgi:7-cyano-7-deazaguanine synthase in queuosine biosynthesis